MTYKMVKMSVNVNAPKKQPAYEVAHIEAILDGAFKCQVCEEPISETMVVHSQGVISCWKCRETDKRKLSIIASRPMPAHLMLDRNEHHFPAVSR